jgi:hypothetical protein
VWVGRWCPTAAGRGLESWLGILSEACRTRVSDPHEQFFSGRTRQRLSRNRKIPAFL